MIKTTKKISLLIFAAAFGMIGCNPGIIDVPPPSVTNAAAYFFPENSLPVTFQDSSSATNSKFVPLTLSFTAVDAAKSFYIKENPGATYADSLSCTIGTEAVTISGISAHSIIPLPSGYSVKAKYTVVQEQIHAPISHVFAASSGSVIASCDELGMYYSPDAGVTWTLLSVPFGSKNNRITALTGRGKNIFAGTLSGLVFMSTDEGRDWTSKPILQFSDSILAFATDPSSSVLYISAHDTVYKTEALSYISAKPIGASNGGKLFTSLAYFIGNSVDTALIGGTLGNGLWFKLRDGSWNPITAIPNGTYVTSLATTPHGVYCATTNLIFFSTNGTKWGQIQASIPYGILCYDDQRRALIAANPLDSVIIIRDTATRMEPLPSLHVKYLHDISSANSRSFAATDSGLYELSSINPDHWLRVFTPSVLRSLPKEFPGEIVLLRSRTGSVSIDSSWQVDTLISQAGISYPITARIISHLDQVTMADSTKYTDVIEVRYSYEVAGQPIPLVPYWDIFFTKDKGPIIIYQISNSVKSRKIYRSQR